MLAKKFLKGDSTDKAFRVSLMLKGLDGALEIIGGIFLLMISPQQINHFAKWITEGQLSEDPNDFIAKHVLKTAHHLAGTSLVFGAIYLLSHGIVKVVLVNEVLRGRLWAYKGLIGVTALFIVYQLYRITFDKFSMSLALLTVFDFLIIYLTHKEYRRILSHKTT